MSKVATFLLAVAVATGCAGVATAQRDTDTSYDQVELNRGDGLGSGSADRSYDAVEALRVQITSSL